MKMNKLKQELSHCTGSENYYKEYMDLIVTDGIKELQSLAKCNWLISDIAVIAKLQLKEEEFLTIIIEVDDEHNAVVYYDDGNGNILFKQEYDYTDFSVGSLKLFYSYGVLMIPSEY